MVSPTCASKMVTMAASKDKMGSVIMDQYLAEQCSTSDADKAVGKECMKIQSTKNHSSLDAPYVRITNLAR